MFASFERNYESIMLKTDCVVTKMTPPISCALLSWKVEPIEVKLP